MFTVIEAAEWLGYTDRHVRRLVSDGTLPATRHSPRKTVISLSALENYIHPKLGRPRKIKPDRLTRRHKLRIREIIYKCPLCGKESDYLKRGGKFPPHNTFSSENLAKPEPTRCPVSGWKFTGAVT
jgi:excisionase family DNA binding protein